MDVTEIILLSIAGVALALELWALAARRGWVKGPRLISPVMREDGRRWLFWPWGWGILAGHFWFPVGAGESSWVGLVAATVAVVAVDLVVWRTTAPRWAPFALFIAGAAAGSACWAMGVR